MLVLLPQVVRTFREKGIPCDVVWMDIDYMDGFRCFTFDSVSTHSVVAAT
jgi:alpha-glucosidase